MKGTPNKRTMYRRQLLAETPTKGSRSGVPINKLNMIDRLRAVSDFFFMQAQREQEKGEDADLGFVIEMMQRGAYCAEKAAPYSHPKLAVMQVTEPAKPSPHSPLDLDKLDDDDHRALQRLIRKAQGHADNDFSMTTVDQSSPPIAPVVDSEDGNV